MSTNTIYEKYEILPDTLKSEASLFIDFLLSLSKKQKSTKQRVPGFLQGKISFAKDFDDYLVDFKEYMQ